MATGSLTRNDDAGQDRSQDRAVSPRRGDDRRSARGDPVGRDHLSSRWCSTISPASAPTTASPACWSPRTARRLPKRPARCARGAPLRFPTQTVKASTILPDLDKYKGPPLEFGRMEPTASDPTVQQQFGMIVGIPNAGQVNALGTLNIRGERSVTCRGDFDRHPSLGPLPPGAPPVCEFFRQQPDALERAAELDAAFGRNPDLDKMPMYGVVFSFKDPFDTKDMRSTGGGDARLRHRLPGARPCAGRAAAQQGRDHLRQGGQHRIQRPRRRSRRPQQARQGAAVDARLSAQHLGRQSVEPLRHHALGLARLELGLGACRSAPTS